jgi:hypothetical protein
MAKRKSTKGQKRSTKHTYKTRDRVTRTPLKPGVISGAPLVTPVVLIYSYKLGDKSWMRKGTASVYDKWNISAVICDTDIP